MLNGNAAIDCRAASGRNRGGARARRAVEHPGRTRRRRAPAARGAHRVWPTPWASPSRSRSGVVADTPPIRSHKTRRIVASLGAGWSISAVEPPSRSCRRPPRPLPPATLWSTGARRKPGVAPRRVGRRVFHGARRRQAGRIRSTGGWGRAREIGLDYEKAFGNNTQTRSAGLRRKRPRRCGGSASSISSGRFASAVSRPPVRCKHAAARVDQARSRGDYYDRTIESMMRLLGAGNARLIDALTTEQLQIDARLAVVCRGARAGAAAGAAAVPERVLARGRHVHSARRTARAAAGTSRCDVRASLPALSALALLAAVPAAAQVARSRRPRCSCRGRTGPTLPAAPMTLDDAVALTLRHSPRLLSGTERIRDGAGPAAGGARTLRCRAARGPGLDLHAPGDLAGAASHRELQKREHRTGRPGRLHEDRADAA